MPGQEVLVTEGTRMPQVTPESIQETVQSIALLQGMVRETLIRDIDYGRIPGTPQDSLWDPGASMIIGSFSCYCGHRRIINLEDSDGKIAVCLEVPVISRKLQQEVGSGVGAASTLETKYKYRWVANPKEWGYDEAAVATFKTKKGRENGRETMLYRIPNPEHSELLNTIIKMASKRAEVDAAEALPGVSSVLRQIFSGKTPRQDRKAPEGTEDSQWEASPRWQRFWGEVTRLGYTQQEAYRKLGVHTMHEWLGNDHTLADALATLRGNSNPQGAAPSQPTSILEAPIQEPEVELEPLQPTTPIDMPWLKESLDALQWVDVGQWLRSHYGEAFGSSIKAMVESLTREHQEEFVAEVQKRLEAQKT